LAGIVSLAKNVGRVQIIMQIVLQMKLYNEFCRSKFFDVKQLTVGPRERGRKQEKERENEREGGQR